MNLLNFTNFGNYNCINLPFITASLNLPVSNKVEAVPLGSVTEPASFIFVSTFSCFNSSGDFEDDDENFTE